MEEARRAARAGAHLCELQLLGPYLHHRDNHTSGQHSLYNRGISVAYRITTEPVISAEGQTPCQLCGVPSTGSTSHPHTQPRRYAPTISPMVHHTNTDIFNRSADANATATTTSTTKPHPSPKTSSKTLPPSTSATSPSTPPKSRFTSYSASAARSSALLWAWTASKRRHAVSASSSTTPTRTPWTA